MKQIFICFLFLTFVSAKSQEKGDYELGLSSGLNIANVVRVDGLSNTSNSVNSINFSFSGEYYFSDRWGFRPKLIFDTKGWADGFLISATEDSITTTDIILYYVTIPFLANWHFGRKRNWYFNFGPYTGFLIDAKDSISALNFTDEINKTDFGLAFGIGYKFRINEKIYLFAEYDAQLGLKNIINVPNGINLRNARQSFNLGALMKF